MKKGQLMQRKIVKRRRIRRPHDWRVLQGLNELHKQLNRIERKLKKMAGELDELTSRVEENNTLVGSAIELIKGLKAKLDAAGTDPAQLKALSDALGAKGQELAEAIAANTPEAEAAAASRSRSKK